MKTIRLNNNEIFLIDISNCDLFGFDELQQNHIHTCTCKYCRGIKRNKHSNTKRLFKRIMNKKRRQITNKPKHYTHYWA